MTNIRWSSVSPDDLVGILQRSGERTDKAALRHQRKTIQHVMKESILNSPVDTHALEDAHTIAEDKSGRRIISKVMVGGVISTPEGLKDVSDYAIDVHENYDDISAYTPGPGTIAKRIANPDRHVGAGYLDRALEDSEKMFEEVLDAVMDDLHRIW